MKDAKITCIAVAALFAAFVSAENDAPAAIAEESKSASEAARVSGTCEKGGAEAKDASTACVVSSTGTVARAEADGAMIQEATKWLQRRAKIVVNSPDVRARAEKGDDAAMRDMARGYLLLAAARTMEAKGDERKAMFEKSMEWLRRRAEKTALSGDADAISKLADEFIHIGFPVFGSVLNLNEEESGMVHKEAEWLRRRSDEITADREGDVWSVRRRAVAGDMAAQRALGFRYRCGTGVEKDEEKAFEWTKKAAEQGDAVAQYRLGDNLFSSRLRLGMDCAEAEAFKWYRMSAEQGYVSAQRLLGLCYREGIFGVEKNATMSVKWYRLAAEQGDGSAQVSLGFCYRLGEGVEKDAVEAVKWYRRAAEQGNAKARCELGTCYLGGVGVKKNVTEAVMWLRLSAEQGNVDAMYYLGSCYLRGNGVGEDVAEAAKWFQRAAWLGHVPSAALMPKVEELRKASDRLRELTQDK